jgi:hypothetical protein
MNNLIEKIATLFNGLSVEQIEVYLLWFTFFLIILGGITQVISKGYNQDPPILLTLIQGILMMLIVLCIGLFVCMVYVSLI